MYVFFKTALRSFIDLGGTMYKHELCLGPMSVNDETEDSYPDEESYQEMLSRIRSIRGNYRRLQTAFSDLADSLGMKTTPVDNCTRLPIALLKSCGYVESVTDRTLYNKKPAVFKNHRKRHRNISTDFTDERSAP